MIKIKKLVNGFGIKTEKTRGGKKTTKKERSAESFTTFLLMQTIEEKAHTMTE